MMFNEYNSTPEKVNDHKKTFVYIYIHLVRRVKCSPQCEGTCFGTLPNECCHPQCAGGCTGPTRAECWVIRLIILHSFVPLSSNVP